MNPDSAAPGLPPALTSTRPSAGTRRLDGLQLRFLLVVVTGAVLFAVVAGALAYHLAHARGMEKSRGTLATLADAVEKTAAIGTYTGDRVMLQELADGLARNPLVASVMLRETSGVVLAAHRSAGSEPANDGDEAGSVQVNRRLVSPFDISDHIGELIITADPRRLEAAARQEALTPTALMVGHTALVALLLYVAAARLVTRPILRLGRDLRGLQPGTSARLGTPPRHVHDELGALIASANALLDGNEVALQRERELRDAIGKMEVQYRQIFDASSAGIFVLDSEGRLINGNPTVLKIIGLPADQMKDLQGRDFLRRAFARPDRVQALMRDAALRNETVSADLELVQASIGPRWVHCLISVQCAIGGGGSEGRLIEGVMYDVTERKRVEHDVRHLAEHDALTGLKNRANGDAAIDRFLVEAEAGRTAVTLLYVDLDGFKQVNDTMGHKAGDQVLMQCAARLQAAVRRGHDLVFRFGGDEFVVAMQHTGSGDAAASQVAAALIAKLQAPIALDDGSLACVGASIGMACFPRHGNTRKQLLTAADDAMYEVKRSGKNAYAMALAASPMP